jgi:hypothetical protein
MAGQTEYCFGHVLVRDVCYQRLPRTERVARHELTAGWLDTVAADRDTDLAEVVAHHRYTAHEIARTLGLDARKYAEPARDALHRAARRTYALHTLEFAAAYASRALSLCDERTEPLERLRIELLATEIAFYSGTELFLAGGGTEQLVALAEQLFATGDRASAARAWTLRGQAAWLRADRLEALSCLDRAVELFDELPDGSDKAEALLELGRLHMLNMEAEPGIAAATAAKEIAERLALSELATSARLTIAVLHYQSGDRNGLLELRAIVDFCREHGLLALRRALQNLAWAMREEGDWTGSDKLLTEGQPTVPGGHNLTTGYSAVVQHSYFIGDWPTLVGAADAAIASSGGEWDLQARGIRAWVRLLLGYADTPPVDALLDTGRRSGFHRLHWTALGHGALYLALQGRFTEAEALLVELAKAWRDVRSLVSGEWIDAAAHAAFLAGRSAAVTVRDMLADAPHRTPWVEAALRTVTAGIAYADGDFARAADMHLAAAEIYGEMPHQSARVLSLAWAVRSLRRVGGASPEPWATELADFGAPVLVALATSSGG